MKVAIVGQGYVGLPLAVHAVGAGHTVGGYDVDGGPIGSLCDGRSFVNAVPDATLRTALGTGRYLPTTDEADLDDFDVAVISVPTPLRDGAPDLSCVAQAARAVARHL